METMATKSMTASGLRRKFPLGATIWLSALSLLLVALIWAQYGQQLTQERSQAAAEVNRLLQSTLENAMLKRDLPGLRGIVYRLGQQPGVAGVRIVAPNQEIRFASRPDWLGQTFPLDEQGLCLKCPDRTAFLSLQTRFLVDAGGKEILRNVNPVANKPQCGGCHGPAARHPINGVLVVDYDAAPIRKRAAQSAATVAGMGALLLGLTLAGGGWFLRRHVLQPVAQLAEGSQALGAGRLDSRVDIFGSDELAHLGQTFNHMAENIQNLVAQIRQQEAFLQALIDAFPDGIRVIDPDTFRIVLDNRAYRELIGREATQSCRGQTCHASSHGRPDPCPPTLMLCPVHEIERRGQPCKVLMAFRQANGDTRQMEVFAAPMHVSVGGVGKRYVVESCRDLARVVKFSQEQKLAEMAQLATGVAHEIHNPLASVRLALNAMLRASSSGADEPETFRHYLQLVDGEIDRCIEITGRLLKLGTAPSANAGLVEVNPAVADTLSLLAWEIETRQVRLHTDYAQPTPRVLASDSELRMVILNLVQNAIHAMPGGGDLYVSILANEGTVQIIVDDSGAGIAPADQPHIFEPFFSRRADGTRGTGLGLSICLSVAQNYGGNIFFTSQPGKGSRFVVELPDAASSIPA